MSNPRFTGRYRGGYTRHSNHISPFDVTCLSHALRQVILDPALGDRLCSSGDESGESGPSVSDIEAYGPIVFEGGAQALNAEGTPVRVKRKRRKRKKKKRRQQQQPANDGGETHGTTQGYEQNYGESPSQETGNSVPSGRAVRFALDVEHQPIHRSPSPRRSPASTRNNDVVPISGETLNSVRNELRAVDLELEGRINNMMETPLVLSALEAGLEVEQVRRVLMWSLKEGIEFESSDELVIYVMGGEVSNDTPLGSDENASEEDINDWINVEGTEGLLSSGSVVSRGDRERAVSPARDQLVDDRASSEGLRSNRLNRWPTPRPALRPDSNRLSLNVPVLSVTPSNPRSRRSEFGTASSSSSSARAPNRSIANRELKGLCVICLEKDIKTVFLPCRHAICCANCSREVNLCPLCRLAIREKMDVYFS